MLDARAPSPLGEREGVRGNEYRGSKIEMRYTQYVIRNTIYENYPQTLF